MQQSLHRRRSATALGPALIVLALVYASPAAGQSDAGGEGAPLFRIVREAVPGGAELLTVQGRVDAGLTRDSLASDVPLVSVLRDTLGDADRENDRLRYVWVHGYTRPSTMQRIASAVPFLNWRMGNADPSRVHSAPPAIIDLADPARDVWKNVLWLAAQSMLFDPYGVLAKTSVRAFRRNGDDYRQAHVIRALAVLSLYEAETGSAPVLSATELHDIQARLLLARRTFGGIVNDGYLQRAFERGMSSSNDARGRNWELLRQRAEAEGLYFEPLQLPDGSATHALVWVARDEVGAENRPFNSRFLNIASPWGDARLRAWTGFSETRYLDADGFPVPPDDPGARPITLIPLALYGLDHPKIPAVLVDFRDHANPQRRELSRRVLNDITRHVLSLSPYGDIHYLLGRTVYDFVTGRRGMDVNQPSRLRSYSQLKLLLSLSSSMHPDLAEETARLLERVSMNPLQNDQDVEVELAYRSYELLAADARSPTGGLAAALERDRRAEYARLEHGLTARVFLKVATIASAGLYRHREAAPVPEQLAQLDTSRRLAYHERFLEEVLASTPVIEVAWDIGDVRRSLRFIADHADRDDDAVVKLADAVFAQTRDVATRRVSLDALVRADTDLARIVLARIERAPDLDPELRALAVPSTGAPEPGGAQLLVEADALAPQEGSR
jgi:hypothetical protein